MCSVTGWSRWGRPRAHLLSASMLRSARREILGAARHHDGGSTDRPGALETTEPSSSRFRQPHDRPGPAGEPWPEGTAGRMPPSRLRGWDAQIEAGTPGSMGTGPFVMPADAVTTSANPTLPTRTGPRHGLKVPDWMPTKRGQTHPLRLAGLSRARAWPDRVAVSPSIEVALGRCNPADASAVVSGRPG